MGRTLPTIKWFFIIMSVVSFHLYGCNVENVESKAEIAAKRAQYQKEKKERLERLSANANKRLAAGEAAPQKVDDPGYPIVRCVSPTPTDDAFIVNTGMKGGKDWYICENSGPGQAILEYRMWYCQGEDWSCVVGSWYGNEPGFYRPGFPVGTILQMGNNVIELDHYYRSWPLKQK